MPASAQAHREDAAAANRRFDLERIEKRILGVNGADEDLRKLARARMDRKRMLRLLALQVRSRADEQSWCSLVRKNNEELRRVADELVDVANHVERISHDPSFDLRVLVNSMRTACEQFLLAEIGTLVDLSRSSDPQPGRSSPEFAVKEMHSLAALYRKRAERFGELLRIAPRGHRNFFLLELLYQIYRASGENHDDVVARLLKDAHQAVGSPKKFSADQIKKFRQRYLTPVLERVGVLQPKNRKTSKKGQLDPPK